LIGLDIVRETGIVYSKTLQIQSNLIGALRQYVVGPDDSPEKLIARRDSERLVWLLRRAPLWIPRQIPEPANETDIQTSVDQTLRTYFGGDYRRKFSIPGVVKNFSPDAGILSLGTAIELKFVDNEGELKKAVSELFEDESGYKGSKDWTKFISFIYMTGPYGVEEDVKSDFKRAAINWTPILVQGPGKRKKKKSKAVPKTKLKPEDDA